MIKLSPVYALKLNYLFVKDIVLTYPEGEKYTLSENPIFVPHLFKKINMLRAAGESTDPIVELEVLTSLNSENAILTDNKYEAISMAFELASFYGGGQVVKVYELNQQPKPEHVASIFFPS